MYVTKRAVPGIFRFLKGKAWRLRIEGLIHELRAKGLVHERIPLLCSAICVLVRTSALWSTSELSFLLQRARLLRSLTGYPNSSFICQGRSSICLSFTSLLIAKIWCIAQSLYYFVFHSRVDYNFLCRQQLRLQLFYS